MTVESKVTSWGEHTIAWVQSEDVLGALNLLQSGKADGLGISPHNGFASEDVSFLADVPDLKGVVLPYAAKYDLKILECIPGLRFLTVAGNNQPINYGAMADLEELRIEWNPELELPTSSSILRLLYIRNYKPKSKNLVDLPLYNSLTELEIVQGNLISLEGIEKLRKLTTGSFFYLRNLQSVSALIKTNLERLHIESCRRITDVENLSRCSTLKGFRFVNCGKLKSLDFLNGFKNLEEFRFVNTIVEDGDMTPLLQLKSVGFLARPGYSHTPEEIRMKLETTTH